jgi:hypothetical protein
MIGSNANLNSTNSKIFPLPTPSGVFRFSKGFYPEDFYREGREEREEMQCVAKTHSFASFFAPFASFAVRIALGLRKLKALRWDRGKLRNPPS